MHIKKIFLGFMFLVVSVLMLSGVNVRAESATTLIVNYHRFDGNYGPWSLWLWQHQPTPGEGQNIQFTGFHPDTSSRQLVYDLEGTHLEGATRVGVIVRTGNWTKDVAQDLFIDMTNPDENGVVEVFLVSQDPVVYYGLDEVDLSDRLMRVDFANTNVIEFETTKTLTADQVSVLADGEPVDTTQFNMSGLRGSLRLVQQADLTKTYTIEVDFEDDRGPQSYDIGFSGIYDSDAFNDAFAYDGELGAIYTPERTTFKIWAPISTALTLNLYTHGHRGDETDFNGEVGTDTPYLTQEMTQVGRGVWETVVEGDLHGVYYTYDVQQGRFHHEDVVDPYTRSAGINGERGMVVDFSRLNPEGWTYGERPNNITHRNEAIVYEAHIRDYTSHETWNGTEAWRGKYLGFQETGTRYLGVKTGFDHFVDLGVTHVQLLPVHDIGMAIDERRINDPDYSGRMDTVFNWGYMTLHFNTLEGSYATDPFDGSVRIEEFKQLVQTFHDHDIRIVLDVVYNHTATSGDSNFEKLVPGYYFRFNEDGTFSNGSGTGNETASERAMMRKLMVDSLVFWTEEYNISGYRFDLMRLHDVDTMVEIQQALHAIDDTILIFGEPWDAGGSNLDPAEAADNSNLHRMPGVGVFNDDTRDGARGGVFNASDQGFVQGLGNMNERIKLGLVGGIAHQHLTLPALPKGAWAQEPYQAVNYVSAHDNNTLHDKLMLSTPAGTPFESIKHMQQQANAIVLLGQGMAFIHGGAEMMRTKPCTVIGGVPQGECDSQLRFDHNSYRSPDATNQIDWNWKVDHYDVFSYHQGLIQIRRNIDVLTYPTADLIRERLDFNVTPDTGGLVSFFIYDPDSAWEYTLVAFNNASATRHLNLLNMEWNMIVNRDTAGVETIEVVSGNSLTLRPNETVVLYTLARGAEWPPPAPVDTPDPDEGGGCFGFFSRDMTGWQIGLASATIFLPMLALGGVIILKSRRFPGA